jgi:hypothetical protein
VAKFVSHANTIGGDAAAISALLQAAFVAQRELMSVVPLTQKPGDKVVEQILDGTIDALKAIAVGGLWRSVAVWCCSKGLVSLRSHTPVWFVASLLTLWGSLQIIAGRL